MIIFLKNLFHHHGQDGNDDDGGGVDGDDKDIDDEGESPLACQVQHLLCLPSCRQAGLFL